MTFVTEVLAVHFDNVMSMVHKAGHTVPAITILSVNDTDTCSIDTLLLLQVMVVQKF